MTRDGMSQVCRPGRRSPPTAFRFLVAAVVVASAYLTVGAVARHLAHRKLMTRLAETEAGPGSGGAVVVAAPWLRRCGRGCEGGYGKFLSRHAEERAELGWLELGEILERPGSSRDERKSVATTAEQPLADRVRAGLAIEELLAGFDLRPLLVAELTTSRRSGIVERRLLFGDPEVGSFEALLLVPTTSGPHPAIIGLHGHRDSADTFADEYMGRALAERGFVVLMPSLRAHDCSVKESVIALRLLRHGSTLMGLKVYETLLLVRFLDSLAEVDRDRIGIVGHSGGSSIADLVVRMTDRFAAKVTDLQVDYDDRCGPLGVHCETIPELLPLAAEIADEKTLGIPSLHVPYGYEEPTTREEIATFLDSVLGVDEPR